MDLSELRGQIDRIDAEILELFVKRMEVCRQVGEFKRVNKIPVMQGNREQEVIERIVGNSPNEYKDVSALFFQNIMDISKSLQNIDMVEPPCADDYKRFVPENAEKIACQGTDGAYSETACKKLFGNKPAKFYHSFEDVFSAVESGEADFGILPLENSTIGSISETYELMAKHDFYVNSLIRVEITHCLAAKKGTSLSDVKKVYSKGEALSQCSKFLSDGGFERCEYANTALSAELVQNSSEPVACICSESCAEVHGLDILSRKIADAYPNYTRFICFSKNLTVGSDSDIISILLTLPHVKGSLNRLLTKFSVNGINITKIESKSIAGSNFEFMFFLDFVGSCLDSKVKALLEDLDREMGSFRLLGNFSEVE
ncbi:MAG: chorismate mutase [Oscillospiraceae bacterium]|nr:chorismate mutase [Oscillospiraceae bacterium]